MACKRLSIWVLGHRAPRRRRPGRATKREGALSRLFQLEVPNLSKREHRKGQRKVGVGARCQPAPETA